ncbi:MAG: hypothetical protein Q7S40_29975 [Opitutaceae bacterium]|nr:hypothetical protein [Opitutaceae bacterium]
MKQTNPGTQSEPHQDVVPNQPVREPDPKLTPKAQAKAANKLPKAEQLDKFEESLEAHDPGNQPA